MDASHYMGNTTDYNIYYNGNIVLNPNIMYVKVNRFSNTGPTGTYLYEYSTIDDADVLGLIQTMRNQYIRAQAPVRVPAQAPAPVPESIPAPVPYRVSTPVEQEELFSTAQEFNGGEIVKYHRKYLKYKKKYLQMKQ